MEQQFDNSAHSMDGREFIFESPLGLYLKIGDFIILYCQDQEGKYLGQITDVNVFSERITTGPVRDSIMNSPYSGYSPITRSTGIKGSGRILGKIVGEKTIIINQADSFDHFKISQANNEEIKLWSNKQTKQDSLRIGTLENHPTNNVSIFINELDRHTFLTGQTGSGKSSAIRTICKKINNSKKKFKIVIFDFNSEYKELCNPKYYSRKNKGINLSPESNAENIYDAIKIDFFTMENDWQLSLIGIDPIENPSLFFHYRKGFSSYLDQCRGKNKARNIEELINHLYGGNYSNSKDSGYLFDNIDIYNWEIWKKDTASNLLYEIFEKNFDFINIDLGSLNSDIQKQAVVSFTLEYLWRNRYQNQKFLLVIDEAHNVALRNPTSLLLRKINERLINIAGEGRKFGLFLFLCSQQPNKIHENVLSLCNNLILLQTTATFDLNYIYSKFSQVPESFIQRARFFDRGEALIAGPIISIPTFVKFDFLE